MKKTVLTLVLTLAIVLSFSACSSNSDNKETKPAVESASTEAVTQAAAGAEDGQNPVMNYVGKYYNGGAYVLVEADGNSGAKFTVTWGMTDDESEEYTFSGEFDDETQSVKYANCTKKVKTLDAEGKVTNEKVDYTDGTGTVTFKDDKLTWNDNKEGYRMKDKETFDYVYPESEATTTE